MENESIKDYVKRLRRCYNLYKHTDYSLHEFVPQVMMEVNDRLQTHDHTYYFSISSSLDGEDLTSKRQELAKDRSSLLGLGFESGAADNISMRSFTTRKAAKKDHAKKVQLNWLQRQGQSLKFWALPITWFDTMSWEFGKELLEFRPPKAVLCNLENPLMNIVGTIDYRIKDWVSDHDCLIPRYSQEFPRLNSTFERTTQTGVIPPWGMKGEPQQFDHS